MLGMETGAGSTLGSFLVGCIALVWILIRTKSPAKWQDYGIYAAMVMAIIPALTQMRNDPTVQSFVLPIAGGLIVGDVVLRAGIWIHARWMDFKTRWIARYLPPEDPKKGTTPTTTINMPVHRSERSTQRSAERAERRRRDASNESSSDRRR